MPNGDIDLWFDERGSADGRPVVLLHGLFFSRRMFDRLAMRLPDHRMLLLDLRGHGRSTRVMDADAYRWSAMGSDVLALLDHLGLERAIVGGLSLGANVALAFAATHADRLSGAIIEMPVLEEGRPTAERTFIPMANTLDAVGSMFRPASVLSSPLRRVSLPELATIADLLSLEPKAGAAMLRTLMADRGEVDRGVDALARERVPTLVIGHRYDALHPLADAELVARTVPGAKLVVVSSIAELRLRTGKYADIVGSFVRSLE